MAYEVNNNASITFPLHGRRPIYSHYETIDINEKTIPQIIVESFPIHTTNANEINYLYNYYLGIQPIFSREKKYRDEINNKVADNIAYEIIEFKKGYEFSNPVQFITRTEGTDNETQGKILTSLNTEMMNISKDSIDRELMEWAYIGGQGYRYSNISTENENGYIVCSLDPRNTFVVLSDSPGKTPLLGVYFTEYIDSKTNTLIRMFYAHTAKGCYEFKQSNVTEYSSNLSLTDLEYVKFAPSSVGSVPIVEYLYNNARLGAFEVVLGLMDAQNTLASNRIDGVEQFVQAILVFMNVDVTKAILDDVKVNGAISITGTPGLPADVKYIAEQLDQGHIETAVQSVLDRIEAIVGLPNRQARTGGGGDTGQAVALRDGWAGAEVRAKSTEVMFKRSERMFLSQIINLAKLKISSKEIDIKFTRNRSDNLLVKAQALSNLISTGIDPESSIEICEISSDSHALYEDSPGLKLKYAEQQRSLEFINNPDTKTAEVDSAPNGEQPSSNDGNSNITLPLGVSN